MIGSVDAQSLVRFLVARDRKAFVKFVHLMKQGKSEADALKEAYNLTREDLIRLWRGKATKALRENKDRR